MNNELVPQPSWWKRNWKWVVPVSGCFTVLVIIAIILGSIFYGVSSAIDGISSTLKEIRPYEYALEKINEDEDIINALGSPIIKDGPIQSTYNNVNGNKEAKLVVPVSGPNGFGTLFVEASGRGENWTYDVIRIEINDHEDFDLLEEDNESEKF